jgi:hypothetical protein
MTMCRPSTQAPVAARTPQPGTPVAAATAPAPASNVVVIDDEQIQAPPAPPHTIETTCDGHDDDADGRIDALLPLGPNACTTSLPGACGRGWAGCIDGNRTCVAPPPTAEVFDGVDNDCNGVVDDVQAGHGRSRALLIGPRESWSEGQEDIDNTRAALDQAGIAYDVQPALVGWETLVGSFGQYSLIILPGFLEPGTLPDTMRAALEAFATQGGVVVVMKPIGDVDENDALALAGLADSQKQRKTTSIRVDGAAAPALLAFDSTRERVLPIAELDKPEPIDVFTYTVDPKAGTTELAHAFARAKPLGAVATRRPLGRGAIYAWGFDLQSYEVQPCYVNCFEPSGDLLRLFLRDALREGVGGHLVVKHTMPGPADSALLVTHDIDAPDAYSAGTWGGAGVTRMAEMENRHHVHATYNITTDYVAGYFRSKIIRELCQAGMCPVGGHSVQHLTTFDKLTRGTCKETKADYEAKKHPTLCGEIRVPLEMLTTLTGERPRVWRSPFLFVHPVQFDVLRSEGIQTDSSFGIGDLKYNLPVDAERAGVLQDIFHHAPIYEFPIVMEDGIGWIEHGEEKRRELQASNLTWFETGWEDALLGNAANGSLSTLLVHPSLGADVPDDNIELKINAVAWIIETAQAHKIPMDTLLHFGDFWRARAGVRVDASYDAQKGYQGVLEVGALPITDFTLEFGDALASFTCPGCGRIELHGKRAVFRATLAPRTKLSFSALPRPAVTAPAASAGDAGVAR